MTYKKVDQMFRRWMLFYVVHCALGTMTLLSGILKRDGFVFFLGLMINGSSMWSWRKMNNHRRLRRQIIEAWEKKFEDPKFLLGHANQSIIFLGDAAFSAVSGRDLGTNNTLWCASRLWEGQNTSKGVSLDCQVEKIAKSLGAEEGRDYEVYLYKCLLVGLLTKVIESDKSDPRVFRIGQMVFQCAKEHYPLEAFKIPIEDTNRLGEPVHA